MYKNMCCMGNTCM